MASASASPDLPDDFGELLHALERGEVEQAARTEKSAAASDDAAGTLARLREMCSKITKNSSVHVECGIGMPFWATVVVRVHSWHAEFNGLDTTWSAACEMGADAAAQCIDAVPPCVWRCYEPTLEQPSEALSKSESNPVETRQQQPSEASTSAPTPVENRAEVVAEAGRQAKDYKSKLGEIVMRRTRKAITENVLRYVVTEPTGPGNGFRCEVVVRLDEGTGSEQSFSGKNCSSKKEAMQAAAEQACQHLESVATHRPQQPAEASTSAPTPVENRAEVVAEPARQAKDYKSKLGEIVMQRTRKAITENVLRYVVTEPTGAGNGFRCKVVVRLDERTGSEQSFSGKNCSSKKEAMQAAAEQACQHLESVATHRPQQPAEASTSAPTPVENRAEVVAEPARQAKDYKSKLGEIVMQRTRKAINENVLRYVVTEPTGPGNGFRCTVVVRLDEGTGSEQSFSGKNCSSKKEAMQAAAEQACQHLESVATHRPQQPAEASTSAPTPVENRAEVVAEPARQAKDHKSKLGEIVMQRTRKAINENVLRYVVTEPTGPGNGFRCTVVVRLDEGTGSEQSFSGKNCSSKKEAMQAAAEQACQHLESVATHRPQQPAEASTSAPTPVENRAEVVAEAGRKLRHCRVVAVQFQHSSWKR